MLTLRALRAGYVVLLSDSDVAFTTKPLFELLTQLAVRSHADGAFQEEGTPRRADLLQQGAREGGAAMQ